MIKFHSDSWLPGPRYLCRKHLVLKLLRRIKIQGHFLEIGVGGSDLAIDLCRQGIEGTVIDFSSQAVGSLKQKLRNLPESAQRRLTIKNGDFFELDGSYKVVMAFEVLEHIPDDSKGLSKLRNLLIEGGFLLLSVPAHQRHWGSNDIWAGHVRRYERAELLRKLQEAGFDIIRFWSYGFPIANIVEPIKNRLARRRIDLSNNLQKRTQQSGTERFGLSPFRFFLNNFFMAIFYWLQECFLKTELGNGYLVCARKRAQ